jgi:Tol biopolymer transport system component
MLVISNFDKLDSENKTYKSSIYTLPINGGTPKLITKNSPSYWHGWSPNGKTLAYCAERNGNFDIYTIPVDGGEEKRLTISDGLDDGPDYSSDGKYIYFNSYRTGHMQIWRMQSDGTNQEQLTLMIIQIGLHIHHLITNGSYLFHTCLMRSKIICLASMFN